MPISDDYTIREITHKESYDWLLNHHYARRIPNICYSFGLFDKVSMVGVITFGYPPAPTEQELWKPFELIELNRLCVKDGLLRNTLSYFVSNAISMLPQKYVIISYADIDHGHHGYIYQATNWIYTGIGSIGTESYIMNDGKEKHSRHKYLIDMNKVIEVRKSTGKHRYFYFLGDRKTRRDMKSMLERRYRILPYPKGQNERYDVGIPVLQSSLFDDTIQAEKVSEARRLISIQEGLVQSQLSALFDEK